MKKFEEKNIPTEELKDVSGGNNNASLKFPGDVPVYAPCGNLITFQYNSCDGYLHNPDKTDRGVCDSCKHFDYRCFFFGQCMLRKKGNDPYAKK